MPTGARHNKYASYEDLYAEDCRCMIGADHVVGDDGPMSEYLSQSDAEDIWLSSGMDEDYDFR
ncbi:hypothetical protein [Microbacterium sp. SCN 69-37]|uniref:hypothetical protein n=1 Tax=Microbacterium sp. SCN 69-37 TaxID=1660115 RepID=UPI00086D0C86|nr:hypothetical protein [Microbacterium sp. SCN 69-37]ODT25956.1 MAG: hypothetical protein ABS64_00205 [Microbacterium sp. SCN 69-37]